MTLPNGYLIYNQNNQKYIRRVDAQNGGLRQLTIKDGVIVEFTGYARSNDQALFVRNLKAIYGDMPIHHQRHHLVPVGVADNHPLFMEAAKHGYIVDRASNGRYLAETAEDMLAGVSDIYPTHLGSHPKWDARVTALVDDLRNELKLQYGDLSKVPDNIFQSKVLALETQLESVLKRWGANLN